VLGQFGRLDARVSVVTLLNKSYLIGDGSGIGAWGAASRSEARGISEPRQANLGQASA
jgi:hypothetical protein